MMVPKVVAIANPCGLGDAVMILPLAGVIKRRWPNAKIIFVGKNHLRQLIYSCNFFDSFIDRDLIVENPNILAAQAVDIFLNPFPDRELARVAFWCGIPIRVGNLLRSTAIYCNRFVAYNSTLRSHILHYFIKHLAPLGIDHDIDSIDHVHLYGLTRLPDLDASLRDTVDPARFNLVIHPCSGGSGREWPLLHYLTLIKLIKTVGGVNVILTGSDHERSVVLRECPGLLSPSHAVDLMGRLDLGQLLALITATDGVLASSTGPVHVAAALGRKALGIYAAGKGLTPEAWAPIGPFVSTLRAKGSCTPGIGFCPKEKGPPCPCVMAIDPQTVLDELVIPAALTS